VLSAVLNPLGLALFRHLCNTDADVVVCPLSISSCLRMAAVGTTDGSTAQQQMHNLIGAAQPAFTLDSSLEMASSAWIRGEIKPNYTDSIQELGADIRSLKDVSPAPINAWVKEKTHGKIESLLERLDPLTVMVLVNTVFFKGSWAVPFDPTNTKDGMFRKFDGALAPCRMMYMKRKDIQYTETDTAMLVRLPYASGNLAAIIALPKEEGPEALRNMIASLTPEVWLDLHQKLRFERPVQLKMPRFKVEYGTDLSDPLKALGMPAAFDSDGGFLKMSDDPQVHISSVAHKAVLEVNEEGTVASAAIAITMATRSLPPPPVVITVDRPFIFVVSDAEGAIVFIARALSPSLSGISEKSPQLRSDL